MSFRDCPISPGSIIKPKWALKKVYPDEPRKDTAPSPRSSMKMFELQPTLEEILEIVTKLYKSIADDMEALRQEIRMIERPGRIVLMDAQIQMEDQQDEEMEEEIKRNPQNSIEDHESQGSSPESDTANEIFDFKEKMYWGQEYFKESHSVCHFQSSTASWRRNTPFKLQRSPDLKYDED